MTDATTSPVACAAAAAADQAGTGAGRRGWVYVVCILTTAYVLNFVDRQVVNILAEPIKRDLGLADWQLGVLTGLSFALVYGAMALPIARLAERVNRPRLIAGALTIWSGSTIACSYAQGFGQLAAARIAVGVGESGFTPAAHSLITGSVPKARRTLAFGIFATGLPLGGMIAMALGGLIADRWGWRSAFLLAGVPGIVLALVVLVTIREPRRADAAATMAAPAGFIADARYLLDKKSFILFVLGQGMFATSTYGVQAFLASFLMRLHGPQITAITAHVQQAWGYHLGATAIVGPLLGVVLGITGIGSALLSGVVTDRLVARDGRNYGLIAGLPLLLGAPLMIAGLLAPRFSVALMFIAASGCLTGLAIPALSSCIQTLASARRRATASALSLLASVLFGNGLGPFMTGVLSDVIGAFGYGSGPALRLALVIATAPTLVAGLLFLAARRHLGGELTAS